MKISTTILAGVSASPFLADSQEANAFLSRTRRAWQFFEETKDGNWERECIEEDCNANEAYEVVDEEIRGQRLYDLVVDCKKKYPATANQRKCVENGLQPSWGEWGEWSACSATCINPVTGSMPFREKRRNCQPGVESLTCEVDEMARGASSVSTSGDKGQLVQSKSEPCQAEECNPLKSDLDIRISNGDTIVARMSWFPLNGIAANGELKIYWRINSEVFANYIGQSRQLSYYDSAPASLRSRSKITIDENGRWAELRIKQMTPEDEGMMISTEIHYQGYFDEQAVVVPSSRPDY
ncbi:Oidioi.mRNA.OKI2018_I69.chr2.g5007.t1.cds [Oikopleura dioica]|uniref:Oidioi.mRNA.OKI2018_I69.chr2.g5007.t1.cds n=1 Tax=Oikopleura dioica TaxID=34765 RepID=A0ABN7SYV4_OIKDI|nr:Oidioi.mRNA.OKI2018_I69.chr2.g5007.t1.cds [Oikopleura dioica]